MAHPARSSNAADLVRRLGDLPARIVFDPSPDSGPSTLRTALCAWQPWDATATHHLVLQDDVEPCPHFDVETLSAVRAQPNAALALFAEWGSRTSHALRIAALAGRSWVEPLDRYVPTQALAMPADWAAGFVNAMQGEPLHHADDETMLRYLVQQKLPCLVAIPNLVDHLELPSLAENAWRGARRSSCLSSEMSAPGWWHREPLRALHTVPYFPWRDAKPFALRRTGPGLEDWVRRDMSEILEPRAAELLAEVVARRLITPLQSYSPRSSVLDALADLGIVVLAQALCAASMPGGPAAVGEAAPIGLRACATAMFGVLRGVLTPDEHHQLTPELARSIQLAVEDVLHLFRDGRLAAISSLGALHAGAACAVPSDLASTPPTSTTHGIQ